jgi:hypothetical protein
MNNYPEKLHTTIIETLIQSIYALFISSSVMFIFNIPYVITSMITVHLHINYVEEKIKID